MPHRQRAYLDEQAEPPESMIKQAQPILQILGLACACLIWGYNTFALKETVSELKASVASVEMRCTAYSDNNRHRMEERVDTIFVDFREQLTYLRNMINKRRGD